MLYEKAINIASEKRLSRLEALARYFYLKELLAIEGIDKVNAIKQFEGIVRLTTIEILNGY